jgi:hypothetical protein
MYYEVVTPVDVVKAKLETAINIANTAKLLIPNDKAPMTLKGLELVVALVQTKEFQELAAFGVDLTEVVVKHFAHKVKNA